MLIKTVKKIRMNGAIVEPGEVIRVDKDQGLMARGYARELTREETRGVLADYVQFAEKIFNESARPDAPCKNCYAPASKELVKTEIADHKKAGESTTTKETVFKKPPNSNG